MGVAEVVDNVAVALVLAVMVPDAVPVAELVPVRVPVLVPVFDTVTEPVGAVSVGGMGVWAAAIPAKANRTREQKRMVRMNVKRRKCQVDTTNSLVLSQGSSLIRENCVNLT